MLLVRQNKDMNKIYSRYCDNYIFAIFDDVQHKNSQPESVDKLF